MSEIFVPPVVSREQVAARISLERLIPEIERGFRAFHDGRVQVAPWMFSSSRRTRRNSYPRRLLHRWRNSLCESGALLLRQSRKGLPTMDCVIVVSSRTTGRIKALICDGGLLSDMRTAVASAVAANVLARKDAGTVGLVGAGNQAYWHARALCVVRKIRRIKIWSRSTSAPRLQLQRLASSGVDVAPAPLADVANCDIVVTATPARSPVLNEEQFTKGACVIAMGADTPGKRELRTFRVAWRQLDSGG